ncbi:hypothetical protein EfaCPT1_gp67 [Enterococcus phage EfaCPT1]|uniref:Uncharacterized protein n=1 Tax=Enterococcus phage EfaCPT1 TaxID=1204540 RepID=I7B3K3_9CAUD|nr:hypothetical protein EfaCPT1_gp67 [Enterococcus phage EfaCPT1]AFO10864.1 hypothetical protein EfaCPT1_gp67 [Enterococcus phage EfaCPT1]
MGGSRKLKWEGVAKIFRPPLIFLKKLIGDDFFSHEFLKTKVENMLFPLKNTIQNWFLFNCIKRYTECYTYSLLRNTSLITRIKTGFSNNTFCAIILLGSFFLNLNYSKGGNYYSSAKTYYGKRFAHATNTSV